MKNNAFFSTPKRFVCFIQLLMTSDVLIKQDSFQ